MQLCAFLLGMAFASFAAATVSSDAQFLDISTKLVSWCQGTLGSILRLGSLIIGMAIAVKTQRLPVPIFVTLTSVYFPEVVETVFGALV